VQYAPTIYLGSAAHYRYGRPAYSPELEAVLTQETGLDGNGRLLDAGMLEPGGALALIVHTVTGGPGHQTPGCLRSLMMRSRRWWRNISDLPGAPAKASPQNELTASRMCWPGLALVFRSSSSSQATAHLSAIRSLPAVPSNRSAYL
jgi:hypothetical protein